MCDYIQARWGAEKLLDLVHQFAIPRSTPEAIKTSGHGSRRRSTRSFRPGSTRTPARWWPASTDGTNSSKRWWLPPAPNRTTKCCHMGEAVIALYPDYVYDGNAYQLLAEAALAKGKAPIAMSALAALRETPAGAIRRA